MDKNRSAHVDAVKLITATGSDFELVRQEIDGADYTVYKNAANTLQAYYLAATEHGEKEFVIFEGERWSFADVFQKAWSMAHALVKNHQIAPGERVGIAMRNYPEWLSAFIAITSIGAVAVPINSWGKARDLAFVLSDSECKSVFCDQQRYDLMADGLAASGVDAVIVRSTAPIDTANAQTLEAFIAGSADAVAPLVTIAGEDHAMIMYTSGTTGRPKGALSTHRAICQALMNFDCTAMASAIANPELIGKMMSKGFEPVQMLAVPLFHVSGLHAIFLTALGAGRKLVMMYKWDAEQALKLIAQEKITILSAAPSMLQQLVECPAWEDYDTASLVSLGAGGAATPAKVSALMKQKVEGLYPGTGWGMTETNSIGTAFTGQAFIDNPGSAGFSHPTVQIKVCDGEGHEVTAGTPGRLWIKTATAISGYWKRPEANAESFREGWFDTEDIGYLDNNDYLFLSDRAKDMIIRGGENIYPAEIEAVFSEHPDILESAAYGLADEKHGEQVAVAIVPREGAVLTEQDIKVFAKENLAAFKVPVHVSVRDSPLPRNAAGKVVKSELK